MYQYVIQHYEVKLFAFLLNIVFLNSDRSKPTRKILRSVGRKPVTEILRNFGTVLVRV